MPFLAVILEPPHPVPLKSQGVRSSPKSTMGNETSFHPPTPCRVHEWLPVCHQRGLCYVEDGKRSCLCGRMHGTLVLTHDSSPFRSLSVPPCRRSACTPPTPTSVQTLNFRHPLATSLTLWKVQQIIQNFKRNSA